VEIVDKVYAMSSFLQFRTVYDAHVKFSDKTNVPRRANTSFAGNRVPIHTSGELYEFVESYVKREAADGKTALALSGGIDSAICAAFMPKSSTAYTFRCVVPGKQVTDESKNAKRYCETNGLEHRVIDVYWEDYEALSPVLMRYINAPFHSIDIQIYKAALQVKKDGFEKLIFGQGADLIFGGFDKLLSRNWTIGEFIDRYSCVLPYKVLKEFRLITEPFDRYEKNGYIRLHNFLDNHLFWEDIHSYHNSCAAAGIEFAGAYMNAIHKPLDIERVRSGESKYLVREVFKRLYPDFNIPKKTPMPRPMDEWFENWTGPKRPEFRKNCQVNMTGDQKYYIWVLEKFLDVIGE
jgi:asparagine synthetase B (glutamine-hydrolysing)